MATTWRAFRRRIMTPSLSAATLAKRGFYEKSPAARDLLETIGRTFLTGYAYAAEAGKPADAEPRLEKIPREFRGFGYEGAAMALSILDALPIGERGRVAGLLSGKGGDHVYMAYVGMGWAMARLPRFLWRRLWAPDPLLRWLVLDGYGFHQAYFHTRTYVREQFRERGFPWPADAPPGYPSRVIDQGIGRAMWFVAGADVGLLAQMIGDFPRARRGDLYSGAGLAASYAGGAGEGELRLLWKEAGDYRADVAQGCAFAAKARLRAGLVTQHTDVATRVFCGMTTRQAAQVTDDMLPGHEATSAAAGDQPAYEAWRRRIAGAIQCSASP